MLVNVSAVSEVYKGSARSELSWLEQHKPHPDHYLDVYNDDSDLTCVKKSCYFGRGSTRGNRGPIVFSSYAGFLPVQKVYGKSEILIYIIGLAYALVHFLEDSFNVELVLLLLYISLFIWISKKHYIRLHWGFFHLWIKQMKVIILILASVTILWTDTYWGVSENSWTTLTGTIMINSIILFSIQIDIMEMSIFFRASIPIAILIVGCIQMYMGKFFLEDIPLSSYKGHTLYVLDIQNVAWSQVLVFAMLGLRAVVTDTEHKKFYLIEENEDRGVDYTTLGCTMVTSDIALLLTSIFYACAYYLNAKPIWQFILGLLLMFIGTLFLRGVKMKWWYFLNYRPALLVLSAVVIFLCEACRLWRLKSLSSKLELLLANTLYIYCVIVAILSDFHTRPTKLFRVLVPLLLVANTCWCMYYSMFIATDYKIITVNGHTLGINTVERNAYCQILVLLIAQLFSLISDHHHLKFFLIPKRCNRDQLFARFSDNDNFEKKFNEKLLGSRTTIQGQL